MNYLIINPDNQFAKILINDLNSQLNAKEIKNITFQSLNIENKESIENNQKFFKDNKYLIYFIHNTNKYDNRNMNFHLKKSLYMPYLFLNYLSKYEDKKIIFISNLIIYKCYNDKYIINEQWKPFPHYSDESILYYLTELLFCEFSKTKKMKIDCLRYNYKEILNNTNILYTSIFNTFTSIHAKDNWNIFNISNLNKYPNWISKDHIKF